MPSLPVLLSTAIIHADESVDFYIDPARLPAEFASHVGEGVRIHQPEALEAGLQALNGKQVLIDPATSNAWAGQVLRTAGASLIEAADPCLLPKAAKKTQPKLPE